MIAQPSLAEDKIRIGFITKFPVPYFATMEDAAKAYAAAHPEVEFTFGQGKSATDIEGQIALIESMVSQGMKGIALTPVDPTVATALDKAVAAKGQKLNWKTSIVDLMKALDLDSSLQARQALAKELNYTGDTNDSAKMNIWLHGQVMKKVAENGGKVPADLKD